MTEPLVHSCTWQACISCMYACAASETAPALLMRQSMWGWLCCSREARLRICAMEPRSALTAWTFLLLEADCTLSAAACAFLSLLHMSKNSGDVLSPGSSKLYCFGVQRQQDCLVLQILVWVTILSSDAGRRPEGQQVWVAQRDAYLPCTMTVPPARASCVAVCCPIPSVAPASKARIHHYLCAEQKTESDEVCSANDGSQLAFYTRSWTCKKPNWLPSIQIDLYDSASQ